MRQFLRSYVQAATSTTTVCYCTKMTVSSAVSSKWVAAQLSGRSAATIAADLGVLIRKGEIPAGTLMPGVRPLASQLGVSPSTISAAWLQLKQFGLVKGRGRSGIRVEGQPKTPFPIRYNEDDHYDQSFKFDLGFSVPDTKLLPNLRNAFNDLEQWDLNNYRRVRIVPSLEAAVGPTWPYQARSFQAVNGGYEGLRLAIHTFINPGDWVLVDAITTPRSLDIIDDSGARTRALERDMEGILPSAMKDALYLRPAAILLQPGVHVPLGSSMSQRRAQELASLLRNSSTLVIESDEQNALFDRPVYSLSQYLIDKHIYIRSYSKSHGPDLRIAILEGPEDLVSKVHGFFAFGAAWTSRLLQEALAWMLNDPECISTVRLAEASYQSRSMLLAEALRNRGVAILAGDGLEIVVDVSDEEFACGYLKASGIAVQPGMQFSPGETDPWIRVSITSVDKDNVEEIATRISEAVKGR